MDLFQTFDFNTASFGKMTHSVNNDSLSYSRDSSESTKPPLIKRKTEFWRPKQIFQIETDVSEEMSDRSREGMCHVHWGKKSEYKVRKGKHNIEICKKCAVKFASKGIKVELLCKIEE